MFLILRQGWGCVRDVLSCRSRYFWLSGIYEYVYIYIYIYVHVCVCVKSHIYIWIYNGYKYIYIHAYMIYNKNQCACPSMQGMRFFRSFAHAHVKPIVNSTKWKQSAVKRKAFAHGAKSMVRESAIGVVEIARCLLSKPATTAGPQRTTLSCFFRYTWCLGLFGLWPHLAHGCLTVVFPAGILPTTVQHVRLATAQMIKTPKKQKKSRHPWTIEAHCRFTSYFEQTNQLAENNINPCGKCNSVVWWKIEFNTILETQGSFFPSLLRYKGLPSLYMCRTGS